MAWQERVGSVTSSSDEGFDLLDSLLSSVPVGLAILNPEFRYLRLNDAYAVLTGVPADRLVNRTLAETAPGLWPLVEPLLRRALEAGEATYDQLISENAVAADGRRRRWRASCFPLLSDNRVVGVGISLMGARLPLQDQEARAGANAEVNEIQYTLDIGVEQPAAPDRVLDMLGIARTEFADGDDAFLRALYPPREPVADQGSTAELSVRWVLGGAEIHKDSAGQQTLIGTVQHITERDGIEARLHQMQLELLHVSRLSAMGQMSSTLAHEVNQPLTAIGNYIRAGLMMLEAGDRIDPAKTRAVFEKAGQQAARASAIIRNLREFVRKGDAVRRSENLTILVQEAMALARLGIKDRGLKVRLQLDGEARWALVNRVQIQQVLVNLIRNAIEAMADSPRRELVVATASGGAGLIEVSVADSGPGLSEKIADELFKPFMTTKPDGMGVGLAICQSIVEAHGGTIRAEFNPEGGTIFRFTLPRANAGTTGEASE